MSRHREIQPILQCDHIPHLRVTNAFENGHVVFECTKCYSFLTEEELNEQARRSGEVTAE